MEFDWDDAKDAQNVAARGLSFREAASVFADPDRLDWVDLRQDYGEIRRKTIGKVGSVHITVVYTFRDDLCRIITAWPSSRKERSRCGEIHPRYL